MSKSSEHCWGDFFTRWWESEEEWFWRFENFSKLKTAFCEYWTSIKIKISMICVSKEYKIKTKMVQEQWLQLKMTFLFFYWVELTFGGEGIKIWWGGGNEQIFGWWVDSPYPLNRENLVYGYYTYYTYTYIKELCQHVFIYDEEAPCTSYTSGAKMAILLLQDLITLCVTDIYSIYFHLSA